MKRVIIASLFLINLLACKKDNTQVEFSYSDHIIAGKTEGLGILYSGIINDTLFFDYPSSSSNRFIDMNEDGKNDFELRFSGTASPGHQNSKNSIVALGSSFLEAFELEQMMADTIPLNDTINNVISWVNDTCILYNYYWDASGASSNSGLWNNLNNKYIGTRILVGDKVLYGWIRIKITNGWNLTLLDYASTFGYKKE